MIPNHYSSTLSDLDLQMVRAVPQGGNWKDIPLSIPSRRLDQIRASYAAGEGSRSTYYGRMRSDAPSHTISTYFNRPGNGSFIHYSQDRMISQREAARLQSFPDSFIFEGSKSAINKQIGNAVPPLLAYQIATALGPTGNYIDLFCGAGGLSLGFLWAGWKHLAANDIDLYSLQTYQKNIGGDVFAGDIGDERVRKQLIEIAKISPADGSPTLILGGPPCQGFSTAGKKRSNTDKRNQLYLDYASMLGAVKPDAFLFENVPGIRNMERGDVLRKIIRTLEAEGYATAVHVIASDGYGVPQRRTRVIIFGRTKRGPKFIPPRNVTVWNGKQEPLLAPTTPTVEEALSDLPALEPGQNGSDLRYSSKSKTLYQSLMRDELSPDAYLATLRRKEKAA